MAQRHSSGDRFSTDNLRLYLREISKIPPLTFEDEIALGTLALQGDEEARRKLVEANLRFVVTYAKKYRNMNVNFMDLINAGNLGLLEAARRYRPDKGLRFITYAVWWIRQAIFSSLSSQSRAFSVPQRVANVLRRIEKSQQRLTSELSREPSQAELASSLHMTDQEMNELMNLDSREISLTQSSSDDEGSDRVIDIPHVDPAESQLMRESMIEQVSDVLQELDPKERQVLTLRFGLDGNEPKTLQEVGEQLAISRERVRQIETKAKQKLRQNQKLRSLSAHLN